ncbi:MULTISPECIES: hypothetical protein [unclassified Mesorhizobium]|uniref:hypothetical protein n=1 Tax=unclassified Mesorhizobium TaxID=325217 RepID=UPI00112A7870|nr:MULTISPECIES: hypothetical protein [unclassified Mesorhizobium]
MFNVEQNIGAMHAGIRRQTCRILGIVMVDVGLEWIGIDRDGVRRQRSTQLVLPVTNRARVRQRGV